MGQIIFIWLNILVLQAKHPTEDLATLSSSTLLAHSLKKNLFLGLILFLAQICVLISKTEFGNTNYQTLVYEL